MKCLSKFILLCLFEGVILFGQSPDTSWTRTYGGTSADYGRSVQQTTDGGYIIAGGTWSYSAGKADVYLIKTNASGDTMWTRTYGGTDGDWSNSVQQTSDGGYIVVGQTESYDEDGDVYLIKTNASGDTLWTRAYGGTDLDEVYSVQQTTDGGYIVAGETGFYGEEDGDVYLIKTNSLGDKTWTKTYGGTDDDWGNSVQQTTDGGYIVAGVTTSSGSGGSDVYLIKLKPEGGGIEEEIFTGMFFLFPADPNPFTTETMVSYKLPIEADVNISVYNMLG
jgi:hypothetical protein